MHVRGREGAKVHTCKKRIKDAIAAVADKITAMAERIGMESRVVAKRPKSKRRIVRKKTCLNTPFSMPKMVIVSP